MVSESKSGFIDQVSVGGRSEMVEEPEVFEDVEAEKEGELDPAQESELDPAQEAELERMAQRMIEEAELF